MTQPISVFKSPAGEAEYYAAYDAKLKGWQIPHEELYVPTRFGETHVIASGPVGAPPLVLLHGMSFAALSWETAIPFLNQQYRIYAPDSFNDLGKSRMSQPITGRADFAAWLVDLFAALKLEKPCMVGHSYGGWLALCLELLHPGTVNKLALISPAATFFPFPFAFLAKGITISFFPSRKRIANLVRWMTAEGFEVTEADIELFYIGLKNFRPPRNILAGTFTDEELSRIQVPALLIIGEKEVIYNPQKAIERAKRWMPNVTARVVANAGHGSVIEKPAEVSKLILEFLGK